MNKLELIEVKAKLTLYSTKNGGRKTGIKSGYQPNHVFEYRKNTKEYLKSYMGHIAFAQGLICPNETKIVQVFFINQLNLIDLIREGKKWWIYEGKQIMGEAIILEVIKNEAK